MDANVSIRPFGQAEFGTRREIKNLNSFRFHEQAINAEIQRYQTELIEDGGKPFSRPPCCSTRTVAKPAPCAARKTPTTTATSPDRTCCR